MDTGTQMAVYGFIGAGLAVADNVTSRLFKGSGEIVRSRKQYAQALDFLLDAYDPKEFETSMKDAEFSKAFQKTQEYFAKKNAGTLDAEKKAKKYVKDTYKDTRAGRFQKTLDTALDKTMNYLSTPKINDSSFMTKAAVGWGIPAAADLYIAGSKCVSEGILSGMSALFGGLAETVVIVGPATLGGIYVGKFINYLCDHRMRKYTAKLEKLEKKLALNQDLKKALEDKPLEVKVQVKKTEETYAQTVKKDEPSSSDIAEKATPPEQKRKTEENDPLKYNKRHDELMDRLKRLGGEKDSEDS